MRLLERIGLAVGVLGGAALALLASVQTWRASGVAELRHEVELLRETARQAEQAANVARMTAAEERNRALRATELVEAIREGGHDAPLPDDLRRLLDADRLR